MADMHIVKTWLAGYGNTPARAYCGKKIQRGVHKDAPMCRACMTAAGWKNGKPPAGVTTAAAAAALIAAAV